VAGQSLLAIFVTSKNIIRMEELANPNPKTIGRTGKQ
jgi:hypothetical protein